MFGSRPFNAIAIVPSASLVAGARNLGGAWIGGAELVGSVRALRMATLTANYTWLETRQDSAIPQFDGKRLPGRPRHQLYVRADVARQLARRLVAVWGDATVVSGNPLDAANLELLPPRRFLGAGIKVELLHGLLLGLEGKNLADARVEQVELDPPPSPELSRVPRAVADFFGYPLPGRAFYATIDWEI
jgi:outer membrane receptor protein involved in Fe transport